MAKRRRRGKTERNNGISEKSKQEYGREFDARIFLELFSRKLEKNERKRVNLIRRGMEFEGKNLKKEVEKFLEAKLEAEEKVKSVTRLGKNTNNNNNNYGVLVQMETLEAKRRVMRNRRLLKDSRIYVDDDLIIVEKEVHKTIWEQTKKEEAKGRKLKRGYMKLIIDGV
ncbi:hypothetical protein K0M31_001802 [Melipona bicolor]|uniref:Uncharacterized protein n=1 Tax=Melipona bicolor TaxID=60889 RepID=A0AA40GH22_9HYME|nr:hypothetical protein K0M31_001802 [Melipona bicolor]